MVLEGMLSPDDPTISASAAWGEFRQQIFLTRSRKERERNFFVLFMFFAREKFFGDDDQISSRSSRLRGCA
jgi:hypothetical protein